jgi:hypothetical protein
VQLLHSVEPGVCPAHGAMPAILGLTLPPPLSHSGETLTMSLKGSRRQVSVPTWDLGSSGFTQPSQQGSWTSLCFTISFPSFYGAHCNHL